MNDWQSYRLGEDDCRYLLERQREEYRYIKNRASQKLQMLLAIISLAASFGFLQVILSEGVDQAIWEIPPDFVNRCSPEALTFSNISFKGIGVSNSVIGFALIALSIYTILEVGAVNWKIQELPQLKPENRLEVMIDGYQNWIEFNNELLEDARNLSEGLNFRLWLSGFLGLIGGLILIMVYTGHAFTLLIWDYILLAAGVIFFALWVKNYIIHRGTDSWLKLNTSTPSPVFLLLLAPVLLFGIQFCYFSLRILQASFILCL